MVFLLKAYARDFSAMGELSVGNTSIEVIKSINEVDAVINHGLYGKAWYEIPEYVPYVMEYLRYSTSINYSHRFFDRNTVWKVLGTDIGAWSAIDPSAALVFKQQYLNELMPLNLYISWDIGGLLFHRDGSVYPHYGELVNEMIGQLKTGDIQQKDIASNYSILINWLRETNPSVAANIENNLNSRISALLEGEQISYGRRTANIGNESTSIDNEPVRMLNSNSSCGVLASCSRVLIECKPNNALANLTPRQFRPANARYYQNVLPITGTLAVHSLLVLAATSPLIEVPPSPPKAISVFVVDRIDDPSTNDGPLSTVVDESAQDEPRQPPAPAPAQDKPRLLPPAPVNSESRLPSFASTNNTPKLPPPPANTPKRKSAKKRIHTRNPRPQSSEFTKSTMGESGLVPKGSLEFQAGDNEGKVGDSNVIDPNQPLNLFPSFDQLTRWDQENRYRKKQKPDQVTVSMNTKDVRYAAYVQELRQRVKGVWIYPHQAKKQGFEGRVKVKISIGPDGHLIEAKILRSSGIQSLDDAALEAAHKASPLPPLL